MDIRENDFHSQGSFHQAITPTALWDSPELFGALRTAQLDLWLLRVLKGTLEHPQATDLISGEYILHDSYIYNIV